ncbi:hypothetical protein B0O99DRAFT_635679 [Bisporella sp. PMI_857]|nr:hypothetical protein B0O99DRAFT_635679 [Bisporella sp. PMI_857]
MPEKILRLDPMNFTVPTDHLSLHVTSDMVIAFADGILVPMDDEKLLEALTLGIFWTIRGRACRIEVMVSFDGEDIGVEDEHHIQEKIVDHFRNAHLWTQLCISPSLSFSHTSSGITSLPSQNRFFIYLNNTASVVKAGPLARGWSLDDKDIIPPETVICATFERLIIKLDFHSIVDRSSMMAKRMKLRLQGESTLHSIFLNNLLQPEIEPDLLLQTSTGSSEGLSTEFEAYSSLSKHSNHNQSTLDLSSGIEDDMLLEHCSLEPHDHALWFPKATKPYTNIKASPRQIKVGRHELEESIVDSDVIANAIDKQELLFQDGLKPPTSIYQNSATSVETGITRKRHSMGSATQCSTADSVRRLNAFSACTLTSAAMLVLLGGHRTRNLQGAYRDTSLPCRSMSALVPGVFCPGFKQMMTHNAKFLPTICNAISASWVRSVQGPGLMRQLQELAWEERDPILYSGTTSGQKGTIEYLRSVVQARVWSMMQQTLFDPSAARKLRWENLKAGRHPQHNEREDNDTNSFDNRNATCIDIRSWIGDNREDEFLGDVEDIFDALPKETCDSRRENGLLGYLIAMEQENIEKEMEEVIFGALAACDVETDSEAGRPEIIYDSEENMLL